MTSPTADLSPEESAVTHLEATGTETRSTYPLERRRGAGLCMSGGGYRAALFHLGGLRRLNELGILSQITTFSSVSGGSIVNAQIATALARGELKWPGPGDVIEGWDQAVTERVTRFCQTRNIRTPAVLHRLRPGNWFRGHAGVEGLADQYRSHLTDLDLRQVPRRPRFVLSATDTAFGVNWIFDSGRRRTGDYQAGYADLPDWPLARAVAASSCFPPVFNPLPVDFEPGQLTGGAYDHDDRNTLVEAIELSDGGVYDNMGLEPVWKTREVVIVSDGGMPFAADGGTGLFWRLQRYISVSGAQGASVRKRWLIDGYQTGSYGGAYWGIGSAPERYRDDHHPHLPGYSKDLAVTRISRIRTDLDRFSALESTVLQTHGYYLADAAAQVHMGDLIRHDAPHTLPPPDPAGEPGLADDLTSSLNRTLLGR
jgi:NTE family protein